MSKRKRTLAVIAIVDILILAVIVGVLFLRNSSDSAVDELADLDVVLLPDALVISDFMLTDHNGESFTKQDFAGNWNLLFFGFTACPDVCPLTMNALRLFYNDLENTEYGDSTQVIMVSVDPARDTVEVMSSYVNGYHDEFVGLTGELDEISSLADNLYIAFTEPPEHEGNHATENYEIVHSSYIAIINPEGEYLSVIRAPHTKERLTKAYFAVRKI